MSNYLGSREKLTLIYTSYSPSYTEQVLRSPEVRYAYEEPAGVDRHLEPELVKKLQELEVFADARLLAIPRH